MPKRTSDKAALFQLLHIAEKNTCASVPVPTQVAENRKGFSKPIHKSIFYFIIATTRSQISYISDFVLNRRLRNALLGADGGKAIHLEPIRK